MSFENNLRLKQAVMETVKNDFMLKESISAGLPQINSFASFDDYLNVPTTMVSGEIVGQPGIMVPIQLGTKYNAVAGIQAGQMIYDASYFASVRLFRKMLQISNLNEIQAREELAYAIAQMYLFIQVTNKQLALVDSNLVAFRRISGISEQHFKNGLIMKTDLDRISVAVNTLSTERDNLLIARNQQLNMLKYTIGVGQNLVVVLADSIEAISFYYDSADTSFRNLTLMKIKEGQKDMASINMKLARAAHLPSLSGYTLFNYQAQVEKTGEIDNSNNWYKTSYIGIKLNIPVFQGTGISNRINQHRIELRQIETGIEDLQNELTVKMMTAKERLSISRQSEARSGFSKELAARVFIITNQQYNLGLKSLTEVLNSHLEYNTAYMTWLNSMLQIKLSELEIAKLNGAITALFQ